jgi:hypothetical protein
MESSNSKFPIGGVSFSANSFLINGSVFLRIDIFAEKPAHHKSANRYTYYKNTETEDRRT